MDPQRSADPRHDDVWVDLLDTGETDGRPAHRASSQAPAGPPRRRTVGTVAVALAALVALVVWPDSAPPGAPPEDGAPRVPAPEDPRLLPWPGRGPWVADGDVVEQATHAWESAAAGSAGVAPPGSDVHPLWAGQVGEVAVAVLQSVGEDDVPRVAQVVQTPGSGDAPPGERAVVDVDVLEPTLQLLVLTYPDGFDRDGLPSTVDDPDTVVLQVLAAPGLLSDDVELRRLRGAQFVPIGDGPDGLSVPWVHAAWHAPDGPVVAAVRVRNPEPGLLVTRHVTPGELVAGPAPVRLVPPRWGPLRRDLPEDYVDALAALQSLGRTSGQVSVLGSTPVDEGRASLVEVRGDDVATSVVVTVAVQRRTISASPARPARPPSDVALGAVRLLDGEAMVVASGPPGTTRVVVGSDGTPRASGPRTTAVRLGRDEAVGAVSAQGYRRDETYVGRSTLDVSDL